MNNILKHNLIKAFLGALFLFFTAYLLHSALILDNARASQHTEDVAVTATVAEWFTLEVSSATLNLGELISSAGQASIGAASTTITTGSNRSAGYTVSINSANAALNGSVTGSIASASPVADDGSTDGYGGQCSSTNTTCNGTFDVSGNTVGVFTGSAQAFTSTSTASTGDTTILTVKASAETLKPSGTYTDTLTLTALSSL